MRARLLDPPRDERHVAPGARRARASLGRSRGQSGGARLGCSVPSRRARSGPDRPRFRLVGGEDGAPGADPRPADGGRQRPILSRSVSGGAAPGLERVHRLPEALRRAARRGADADLVVTSGGIRWRARSGRRGARRERRVVPRRRHPPRDVAAGEVAGVPCCATRVPLRRVRPAFALRAPCSPTHGSLSHVHPLRGTLSRKIPSTLGRHLRARRAVRRPRPPCAGVGRGAALYARRADFRRRPR